MDDNEIHELIARSRIATLATIGPSGRPHLVPMWYGYLDGELWFETKAKSQKAINLGRDNRLTVQVEAGHGYDQLRGVVIDGQAEMHDDEQTLFRVAVSMWERYYGPYSEEVKPGVLALMHKRVAIRLVPHRIRSWDHRKLGMPELPVAGSTAQYLSVH